MKQSKIVTILLVVLIFCGWGTALLDSGNGGTKEYDDHIAMAKEYIERGLYQKAIEEYDAALSIKNTEEVWTAKLEAYANRYDENTKVYKDYLSAVQSAVSYYSENTDYLMTLANLYIIRDDYVSAYKVLNNAIENGVENEKVDNLFWEVKYSYEIEWKAYTGYRPCVNGQYAVNETGVWRYIEEDGTDTEFEQLVFAAPVGESGIRILQDKERTLIIDSKEVIQGILDFEPKDAGVFSEGLVAICDENSYSYYNSLGDKEFGDYTQAGTFINGQAAVQQGDKWFLIDNKGEKVSEKTYEDIILHMDGAHLKNGVMIAKEDGTYKFYKDEQVLGSYSDVDIITDDNMIAVCVDGKWGYVDLDGNEVIPPTYIEAKSFSNGLAAVSNGEHWGFINTDGVLVIDYIFYGADYFNSEGYCMVETGKEANYQLISLYIN